MTFSAQGANQATVQIGVTNALLQTLGVPTEALQVVVSQITRRLARDDNWAMATTSLRGATTMRRLQAGMWQAQYIAQVAAEDAAAVAAVASAAAADPTSFAGTLALTMVDAAAQQGLPPPVVVLQSFAPPATVVLTTAPPTTSFNGTHMGDSLEEDVAVLAGIGAASGVLLCCLAVCAFLVCRMVYRRHAVHSKDDGALVKKDAWEGDFEQAASGGPEAAKVLANARIPEAPPGEFIPPPPPLPKDYVRAPAAKSARPEDRIVAESHFWHWAEDMGANRVPLGAGTFVASPALSPLRRGPLAFVDETTGERQDIAPAGTWGQGWRGEVSLAGTQDQGRSPNGFPSQPPPISAQYGDRSLPQVPAGCLQHPWMQPKPMGRWREPPRGFDDGSPRGSLSRARERSPSPHRASPQSSVYRRY